MNISIFKKYATNVESIEQCKNLLEKEFSVIFTHHESLYAEFYYKTTFLNSTLSLSNNYSVGEDYWVAPDFKKLNSILSVSISHGKKRDRLETDKAICEKLIILNFQLVDIYEKEVP